MGSVIEIKTKGGPKVLSLISLCEQYRRMGNMTKLFFGALVFDHLLEQTAVGLCVTHTITISGPLTFLWKRLIGAKIAAGLATSMQNLVNCE